MASMDYCKFENTSKDMAQCIDGIYDEDLSSDYERRARIRLVKQCASLLRTIGVDVDDEQLQDAIEELKSYN